ncbi:MAG: dTDP-4-dehydrorhamnose reductase [Acidobacteriota bacterium]
MRIAIIGADGQLGSDITSLLKKNNIEVAELTINEIDVADRDSVNTVLTPDLNADLIINTAAFHHVENCEKDPITSFRVNGEGAANVARACKTLKIPLYHISTDYVFDGKKKKPYIESDLPNPLNIYAASKLTGEYMVTSNHKESRILRLSGIYGHNICIEKGYNFVDKILQTGEKNGEVKVVDDEFLTPTFTEEIAEQIFVMIEKNAEPGIYHVSAEGGCSWYEFTKEIFKIKNNGVKVNKAAPGEFAGGVHRPANSVLENKHLKDLGLNIMTHWKAGLKKYIQTYR